MASIAKALAANLARYRAAKGLSQTQLAELIGVTRQTVWSYEKAEGRMNLETVAKLAEALGVEESALVAEPPAATPPLPADIETKIAENENLMRSVLTRHDEFLNRMRATIAAHEATGHALMDPLLEQVRVRMSEPAIRAALTQILATPPLATPEDADQELDRMLEEAHSEKAKKPPKKR